MTNHPDSPSFKWHFEMDVMGKLGLRRNFHFHFSVATAAAGDQAVWCGCKKAVLLVDEQPTGLQRTVSVLPFL